VKQKFLPQNLEKPIGVLPPGKEEEKNYKKKNQIKNQIKNQKIKNKNQKRKEKKKLKTVGSFPSGKIKEKKRNSRLGGKARRPPLKEGASDVMCPKSLPRERGSQPGHSSNELAAGAVVPVTKVKGPTAPSLAVCAAAALLRVSRPRTTSKPQKSITMPQVSPPLPLPSALIVATAAVSAAARTSAHNLT
jgi:hypothetical protein